MSSRTARSVGGSAKPNDQLFSARSINDPQNDRFGESNRSSAANLAHNPSASVQPSPQPLSVREQLRVQVSEDADPLQIEHMMGYCGDYRKTVVCLPNDEQLFVRSLGCLVTLENLNDPHNQRFLRGHDMPVCSVTVSRTGRYIASGQLGTTNYKGRAAPVLLWKGDTGQRMGVLRGLSEKASILAFSQDERFLCGCGDDCLLYIWDVSTGEVVYGQKVASPVAILQWADQKKVNHNIDYELVIGIQNVIYQGLFTYDSFRMQWSMKLRAYTVPPMGSLIRTFFCLDFSRDRIFPYIGTSSGEMLVYRRDTVVFRSCIPVCTNGLQDIAVLSDDSVICGGGDGMFVKLVGSDMTWQKVFELKFDSLVLSLSLAANNQELIVACSSGAIYRYLTASMTQTLVSVSPNSPINAIAFPNTTYPAPPVVYYRTTGTRAGEIRVWDLTDYACLSVYV